MTRAGLVDKSGLARPTVVSIVRKLLDDGVIVESEPRRVAASSGGRPPTLLRFRSSARVVAAARLFGPSLEVVLGDVAGNMLASGLATPASAELGWQGMLDALAAQIRTLREGAPALGDLGAVAVALPGAVNRVRGLWTPPHHWSWPEVHVTEYLETVLQVPVAVVNVAAATLVGQLTREPEYATSSALIYVGKGVGSAATVGGRLIDGANSSAGELGHCVLPGANELCSCGRRGCVEAAATVDHMRHQYRLLTGRHADTLAAMEASTDPGVPELLAGVASRLGIAGSWLVNILNPAVVYLGGNPFMQSSGFFMDHFARTVHEFTRIADPVQVRPASVHATVRGTLHLASEKLPPMLRPALQVLHG